MSQRRRRHHRRPKKAPFSPGVGLLCLCAGFLLSFGVLYHKASINFLQQAVLSKTAAMEPEKRRKKWARRLHRKIVREGTKRHPRVVFLGDSITRGWQHSPDWKIWNKRYRALNAGISADRVQHILWRLDHGLFDRFQPKVVVLMAGVNNLGMNRPAEIAAGLDRVIDKIHHKSPRTRILLLGILPSGHSPKHKRRAPIRRTNRLLARLAERPGVEFLNTGAAFVGKDGRISRTMMHDYLHLTRRGYRTWAKIIDPKLKRMMKK